MNTALVLFAAETCLFGFASLIHAGQLVGGYEHRQAMIAEGVIAIILLLGLLAVWTRPLRSRGFAILCQSLALFGTLIGAFTIAVGVGPRTHLDYVIHLVMITLLVLGLVWLIRWRRDRITT